MKSFWRWVQSFGAPIPVTQVLHPVPLAPMRQQQFPDVPGALEASRQQDVRLSELYRRLVRTNNAYVVRDYGEGQVVEFHDPSVPSITPDEAAELASKRSGIRIRPDTVHLPANLVEAPQWYCDVAGSTDAPLPS